MSLHKVNLNLLPVLRELLSHRSVTHAALALGRSPSAISQGLTQLREMLDDPLLVRTGGRMVLTPRAEQLIDPVEQAYAQMEQVLHADRFDPAVASRLFIIAATDYDSFAHGPSLVAAIQKSAPRIRVRFVDLDRDLHEKMMARDVDFAMMPDFHLGELASQRLQHRVLASSLTVALMRPDHPLTGFQRVGRAELAAHAHVAFYPSWEALGRRSALMMNRQPFAAVAHVAQTIALPYFVLDTGNVALVPDLVAERLGAPLGLIHRPLAFEEPAVQSILAWGALQEADLAHQWFRETAAAAVLASNKL